MFRPPRPAPARSLVCLLLAVAFVLTAFAAGARAESGASERLRAHGPELEGLPGREVLPGEAIELGWSGIEGVRELEILLSTDGGAHYRVAVSPELSPGLRRFTWVVPNLPGRSLRLLIRYNRGGREIEGRPTDAIGVGTSPGAAIPLGLPLPEAPAPARSSERAWPRVAESEAETDHVHAPADAGPNAALPGSVPNGRRRKPGYRELDPLAHLSLKRTPRDVPLRP